MSTLINRIYRVLVEPLIRLYFFYQDLKGTFIRYTVGETRSDEIIRDAKGDVFCVFLLYQKYDIPNNVLNVLEKLSDKGVNIIIVSNMKIKPERRAQLEPFIHRLIVRRNIGRDFGGYRKGVLTLLNDKRYDPERLLILNDSIFYRDDGLDFFIGELLSDHEYVGVAENYEFQYHVGSYALAMGPKIIKDKRFKKYWQKYKMTEVRPKVIKRGEMGLNNLIINRIAVKPHVIYSPRKLQAAIKANGMERLIEGYKSMPSRFLARNEMDIYTRYSQISETWMQSLYDKSFTISSNSNMSVEVSAEAILKTQVSQQTADLIGISKDKMISEIQNFTKTEFEKEMIDFCMLGSQIHWAGALLVNYLNCPLIKNDMVVRLIYRPAELQCFAQYLTPDEYAEFFHIQINRGVPTIHWKGFKRAMLMMGYV